MTSQDFLEGRIKETSALNNAIMNSGIKDLINVSSVCFLTKNIQAYKPAWFYFHNCFGQIYAQTIPRVAVKYERNYLVDEIEGKICIDIKRH